MSGMGYNLKGTDNGAQPVAIVSSCMQSAFEIDRDIVFDVRRTKMMRGLGQNKTTSEINGSETIGAPIAEFAGQESLREEANKVRELFSAKEIVLETPDFGHYSDITEFSGEVLLVNEAEGVFVANVTNNNNAEDCYRAEFDIDEVPSSDLALLRPGALFFWNVGREIFNGTERNVSHIAFRRMGAIGKRHLTRLVESARNDAESIRRAITQACAE